MKLAIFGANSHIAGDLVASFASNGGYECHLFVRNVITLAPEIRAIVESNAFTVSEYSEFNHSAHYDAIINFVGVGDPAQAKAMGATIFDVTESYDRLALAYLEGHTACKYIFLSSGAAYGSSFDMPVTEDTNAVFSINNLVPQDWYSVAKFCAECRHRAHAELNIVDVRVFSYFSSRQSLDARFLLSDVLRAIATGSVLGVSPENMVRDYIVPSDFFLLIKSILSSPPINSVVDCYTLAPVDKFSLLSSISEKFCLDYDVVGEQARINATGAKQNYYSLNRKAGELGYKPSETSLSGIFKEIEKYLKFQTGGGAVH
ncbi:NAD(P)-dependent oxidoreductase [Pseudomonas simiae]|uniref:NAD-dependent epimerase/dehydratase family protein n=1 Tax=Pseudomonas simiae TaxID=321846 RepID=UPI001967D925|nr:NAD-dependent epimerase/dehydratase family protein [Pseudomonas simiae]QQD26605.2 NAD(P)-dependent oxidoreductase [Pseudomonas simiae]